MMRYEDFGSGYGYAAMHHFGGHEVMCLVISIVVLVDLVLLGMWLWKKITKDDCHHNHHHDHNNH